MADPGHQRHIHEGNLGGALSIQERGLPGSGAGVYYAAAGVVKDAILHHLRGEIQVEYLDNVGALFEIAGAEVRGGYPVCGLYRLLPETGAEV